MDRRSFLKGMVATASGVLIPMNAEQRVWALDRTMVPRGGVSAMLAGDAFYVHDGPGILRVSDIELAIREMWHTHGRSTIVIDGTHYHLVRPHQESWSSLLEAVS
jgi:hypothetical protein